MRPVPLSPLLGLLLALPPAPAAAGQPGKTYCYYRDADDVLHISNASSDPRCRKQLHLRDAEAGLYRSQAGSGGAGGARGASARDGVTARTARREPPADFATHIRSAAERYKLPWELVQAVMEVESNYDPRAVSRKGAVGLMQLMPQTSREMYVDDATEPRSNIEGGARYLRILANQYAGDVTLMLAAYNAGPEAVRRAGDRVPNIPETREYVRRVLDRYGRLKGQDGRG
jgi:soluble lytic murein transglycosylase-like protein